MRTSLPRLAVLVTVAAVASACSGSSTDPADRPAGEPVSGGTLRYAVASYPTCLDAALRARLFSGPGQYAETLTDQDENGDIVPRLASSWEITDGGRTYTFRLRDDVTFSDGTPLTAEVVKANLDALVRFAEEGKADTPVNSALNSYAGADVVDEHTVRVRFDLPELGFLRNASDPSVSSPRSWAPTSPATTSTPRSRRSCSPTTAGGRTGRAGSTASRRGCATRA